MKVSYILIMLVKSKRRLHNNAGLFLTLFLRLGETWEYLNENSAIVRPAQLYGKQKALFHWGSYPHPGNGTRRNG